MKDLFETARPIACGNPWETLPGDDIRRFCGDCHRNVHNMANLTAQEFDDLRVLNPDRLCVVYEPVPRILKTPFLVRYAAAILPLLLLLHSSVMAESPPEEKIRSCKNYLYTPMMMPPHHYCTDEQGKTVETRPWLDDEYEKMREKTEPQKLVPEKKP